MDSGSIEKIYLAVVDGLVTDDAGHIDAPIGREEGSPARVVTPDGKPASTRYEVLHRAQACTLLRVMPLTGRTHQIRVHMRAIGHPVHGDALYGGLQADRTYLHAFAYTFRDWDNRRRTVTAMPDDTWANLLHIPAVSLREAVRHRGG